MAIKNSGTISISEINLELQRSLKAPLSFNDPDVRLLTKRPAGTSVSMSNFYGTQYVFYATIDTNVQEINLETWAKFYGWNGIFPAVITINPGVYVWSDNTAVAALTTGTFPRGLTIINNGFIMGKGGAGGTATPLTNTDGSRYVLNTPPQAGGPAIFLGANTTINMSGDNSYIGGGGGGGAGMVGAGGEINGGGGGGAGGGAGGQAIQGRAWSLGSGPVYLGTPGAGGAIGAQGEFGTALNTGWSSPGGAGGGGGAYELDGWSATRDTGGSGAGGGRIFPGIGGAGGDGYRDGGIGGAGGAAGTLGASGSGGGGGWGAPGGGWGIPGINGAPGGNAVVLNGYTCNLLGSTNRIYGAIS